MRSTLVGASVLVTLALAAGTLAQDAPAAKEKKARRLLEVSGAADELRGQFDTMMEAFAKIPNVPEGFGKKAKELANPRDLVDITVAVYVKNFDEADLDGMTAFYETPLGKKMVKTVPTIQKESRSAGEKWGRELALKVLKELQEEKKKPEAK